jgi:hypothetical protein
LSIPFLAQEPGLAIPTLIRLYFFAAGYQNRNTEPAAPAIPKDFSKLAKWMW